MRYTNVHYFQKENRPKFEKTQTRTERFFEALDLFEFVVLLNVIVGFTGAFVFTASDFTLNVKDFEDISND